MNNDDSQILLFAGAGKKTKAKQEMSPEQAVMAKT